MRPLSYLWSVVEQSHFAVHGSKIICIYSYVCVCTCVFDRNNFKYMQFIIEKSRSVKKTNELNFTHVSVVSSLHVKLI